MQGDQRRQGFADDLKASYGHEVYLVACGPMTSDLRHSMGSPEELARRYAGAEHVAGIDACKSGWVAVVASVAGFVAAEIAPTIAELASRLDVRVLAIDIPIGLPDGREPRAADEAARRVLGRRSRSVFSVPPKVVLETEPYRAAQLRSIELTGRGISPYTYGLAKKILEVETWRSSEHRTVREVHPEVSFTILASRLGVGPPTANKKSWTGVAQRIALLRAARLEPPAELGRAGSAGADDVLDAAVAAWTARRIANGEALALPDPTPRERSGQPVAIWA